MKLKNYTYKDNTDFGTMTSKLNEFYLIWWKTLGVFAYALQLKYKNLDLDILVNLKRSIDETKGCNK
jgi:hypothetical protein